LKPTLVSKHRQLRVAGAVLRRCAADEAVQRHRQAHVPEHFDVPQVNELTPSIVVMSNTQVLRYGDARLMKLFSDLIKLL
jgi:hypothetical protein